MSIQLVVRFMSVFCLALVTPSVYAQETEENESKTKISADKSQRTENSSGSLSGSASATTSNSTTISTPSEYKAVEKSKKIQVTGSYIKRVDEEGTTPVQTLSQETLVKSGYNSVADVMRDNAFTSGGARENSLSGNPGAATAGIGAFGADSILVLLDGQRLPKMGGDNSVDLNLIPMAAIERVEILKDGASALYGSDAIGGVMNFITKKGYDGANVSYRQTVSELGGANRADFAGTFGKKFEKGSFMGVVQYRNNQELRDAQRSFSKVTDLETQGSFTSSQGTWYNGATGQASTPNCPVANQLVDPSDGSVFCLYDYSKTSWSLPEINQFSTLLTGKYKISENLESKTVVTGTYRDVFSRLAPAPDRFTVSEDVAKNQLGLADAVGDTLITYRLEEGGGTRDGTDTTLAYSASQTIEGKITGTWNWDLTGTYGQSRGKTVGQGYADKRRIVELIENGQFNPLAAPGQKGDISSALFNPEKFTNSSQSEVRLMATGQVYDGGDTIGPIAMAIGTSAAWQDFSTGADAVTLSGNSYGDISGSGRGNRNYQAVFQELSMYPIDSVEIGAAVRYDNYSDFGGTVNPKLSVSYSPTEKFMFRSSAGTGFRAPNLSDMYNGGSLGFPSFADLKACAAGDSGACNNRQYQVAYSSNPNLTQERSIFYNLGFQAQPKKNWNFSSNFFVAQIDDAVGAIDPTQLMRAEILYGAAALRNQYGININRDPTTGRLLDISMPSAFNIASRNLRGVDFSIMNQAKTQIFGRPVDFITSMDHIQFLNQKSEEFPGLGIFRNRDVNFKNTLAVTAIHESHNLRLAARTISGGDKAGNEQELGVVGAGSLPFYTEYDLNYTLAGLMNTNANFSVGVKNLFNSNRPLDTTAQTFLNTSVYDPIGRYVYTGVDYTF
jgi:iron complex outermembrane recepter protein